MKTTFTPFAPVRATPPAASPAAANTSKKAPVSWIVTGALLTLGGIIMLPTMVLTAMGAVLILSGIAVLTSAYLRTTR